MVLKCISVYLVYTKEGYRAMSGYAQVVALIP